MHHPFRRVLTVAILAGAGLMVGGCSYRSNMTPELDSMAASSEQDYNRYARYIDNNTRSAWNDLQRLLLLDRSSRLTKYPVP